MLRMSTVDGKQLTVIGLASLVDFFRQKDIRTFFL